MAALHSAAAKGHIGAVQLLLRGEANPLVRDNNGHTDWGAAVHFNHPAVVELLEAEMFGSRDGRP